MSGALGTMPNAPLAFVIAQVRLLLGPNFNRDEVAKAMHADLFDIFPRSEQFASQKLVLGPDGIPRLESGDQVMSLGSLDQKEEVLINSNFLALHATKYDGYPQFRKLLQRVVDSMFAHFGPLAIQQVGLRYIDFIYPKEGESLKDYLPAAETMVDIPGKLEETSLHATDIQMTEGRAIVRITRSKGKASLPAELGPVFNLAPSAIMQQDPGPRETAILDIDGISAENTNALKDAAGLMEVFDRVHDKITAAIFEKMTTERALKYWNNKS